MMTCEMTNSEIDEVCVQPWCNLLWMTGLKSPTNEPTNNSVIMCHHLFWTFYPSPSSLFFYCYALAFEENMAASLQVFRANYYCDVLIDWSRRIIGSSESYVKGIVCGRITDTAAEASNYVRVKTLPPVASLLSRSVVSIKYGFLVRQ